MAEPPYIVYDLTIGDAAAYLGMPINTLRNWTNAGWVKCWTTPTGHRRYRQADLDAAVAARREATG